MVIEDTMDKLVETEEGFTCGCGNASFRMTMHLDGMDFYQYNYVCDCGNKITVFGKRKEFDNFWLDDDEDDDEGECYD